MNRKPRRGSTVIELITVVVILAILSAGAIGGMRAFKDKASDEKAANAMNQVMLAEWASVHATGAFNDNEATLDVITPTRIVGDASNDPEHVSLLLVDGTLRLAVKSDTGTCMTRHYPDPVNDTIPVEGTLTGICSAVNVP